MKTVGLLLTLERPYRKCELVGSVSRHGPDGVAMPSMAPAVLTSYPLPEVWQPTGRMLQ